VKYVTDTHSLVWYFLEDARLGNRALKAFESTVESGEVIVPTVVLAEIMFISKKGRTPISFQETVNKIGEYKNFEIVTLDVDILVVADRLDVDLEMHDKLIAATAIMHKATLITKDTQIRDAQVVRTVW